MKCCTVCKVDKPYSEYHRSKKSKDGFGYRCIPCDRAARVKYREENRRRFLKRTQETNWMMRFGMTRADYDSMLSIQEGRCAICASENPNGSKSTSTKNRNFSVDHCHKTGKIRGLLCANCNRGLGLLGDTEESIAKALDYLTDSLIK